MSTNGDGKDCPSIADLVASTAAMTLQGAASHANSGDASLELVTSAVASHVNSGDASLELVTSAVASHVNSGDASLELVTDMVKEQLVQVQGLQVQGGSAASADALKTHLSASAASSAFAASAAAKDTLMYVEDVVGQGIQKRPIGYFADPFVGYFYPFPRHYAYRQYLYNAYSGNYNCVCEDESDLSHDDPELASQDIPDSDLSHDDPELARKDQDDDVKAPWVPKLGGSVREQRMWSQARKSGGYSFGTYGDFGLEF